MAGSEDFAADPRNAELLVYVNGDLVPRDAAKISVFDAGFLLGDGVWEGFRLHRGKVLFAERHLERLYAGARALDLDIGVPRGDLLGAVELTATANRMVDDAYIRLIVTRGEKRTAGQDPRFVVTKPTLVILAEHKPLAGRAASEGTRLFTAATRCTPADMQDMRLNSLARLNLLMALIQAQKAGADEALLLDPRGFVATANAANFFMVKAGAVYTSTAAYCFNGITRAHVLDLCDENRIPCYETDFTLAEAYVADEAFLTGTLGGITPVTSLDGRRLGRVAGAVTSRIRRLYDALRDKAAG